VDEIAAAIKVNKNCFFILFPLYKVYNSTNLAK